MYIVPPIFRGLLSYWYRKWTHLQVFQFIYCPFFHWSHKRSLFRSLEPLPSKSIYIVQCRLDDQNLGPYFNVSATIFHFKRMITVFNTFIVDINMKYTKHTLLLLPKVGRLLLYINRYKMEEKNHWKRFISKHKMAIVKEAQHKKYKICKCKNSKQFSRLE